MKFVYIKSENINNIKSVQSTLTHWSCTIMNNTQNVKLKLDKIQKNN